MEIDLRDADNRVQFKLLMDLLVQDGVSLTLTRWIAGALLERTVVMQLGNWSSATHQLTMGLPQGSPLSPVLYNVYTKGLADLNQNGLSRVLTLADDGLIYKTTKRHPGGSRSCATTTGKCIPMVPRHWIFDQSKQGTDTVVHS